MRKIIIFKFLFLMMPMSIYAQDWFSVHELNERVSGYIIGIAGDTIYGSLAYSYPVAMQNHISFFESEDDDTATEYYPKDIRGYIIDDMQWVGTTITMDTYNGPYKFKRFGILHTVPGVLAIYRVFDEEDKLKKKTNSTEAEKIYKNIPLNHPAGKANHLYLRKGDDPGELIIQKDFRKNFIERMKFYVGDHEQLYQKIVNKEFKISDIDQIVFEYNKWFDANYWR